MSGPLPLSEQILARLLTSLKNATSAGANVFRSLEAAITRDITPAIVITPDSEDDAVFSGAADQHDFIVKLEISARGDPWDSSANQVAGDAHRALLADAQLASLVFRLRKIASNWDGKEADNTAGVLTMKYRFTYLSKAQDICDSTIV